MQWKTEGYLNWHSTSAGRLISKLIVIVTTEDRTVKKTMECMRPFIGCHRIPLSRRQLTVPRVRRSTIGARAFAVAGPTVWNSLPDSLRDPSAVGPDKFRRDLKTYLFT